MHVEIKYGQENMILGVELPIVKELVDQQHLIAMKMPHVQLKHRAAAMTLTNMEQ